MVSLESDSRVEYYNGKYFGKKELKLKKMTINIFNFSCEIAADCIF